MKIKFNYIALVSIVMIAIIGLFTACKEEITGPDTVPISAEIKQVIINNSIYTTEFMDMDRLDGIDSVIVTVPEGTDLTTLEMDVIYSYFGTIEPIVEGTTDLSNPKSYKVTSNVESMDYLIFAKVLPPSLTSFLMNSPVQYAAKIEGDSIMIEVMDGVNLSGVKFTAEFFGESINPSMDQTIDLTVEKPTIAVINKEYETVYTFYVKYIKDIVFTGVIWDCTTHPNDFIAGSINADDSSMITVEDNEFAVLGGKVNHFLNMEPEGGNKSGSSTFYFNELGVDSMAEVVTVIFRNQGIDVNAPTRYAEISIGLGDWRVQFWPMVEKLDITGIDGYFYVDDPNGLDPLNWNTYRITCNSISGEVLVYVNENKDPIDVLTTSMEIRADYGRRISYGDGSSNTYDGLYDYIIVETGGAYSPEDLPLSKILPE